MEARKSLSGILLLTLIVLAPGLSGQVVSSAQTASTANGSAFGNFTVTPVLSAKAMRALTENKETIIVVAMFSARPKTGVRTQFWEDNVADNLGSKEIEVSPGATAYFGAIAVSHDIRHRLDESAPNLLINVASGRRSNKDNLLECDIYQDTLKSATGKHISLNCKLVRE